MICIVMNHCCLIRSFLQSVYLGLVPVDFYFKTFLNVSICNDIEIIAHYDF